MTTKKPKKDRNTPTLVDINGFISKPKLAKLLGACNMLETEDYSRKLANVRLATVSPSKAKGTLTEAKAMLKGTENSLGKEKVKTIKELMAICQKEVDRLAMNYSDVSVIKFTSDYRSALIEKFGHNCPALPFFKAGKRVARRNENYTESVRDASPRRFAKENIERFIDTAKRCLKEENYARKALGVMALTGRRPIEVFQKGSFDDCGKNGWVLFSGQAKTKGERSFEIPVLGEVTADDLNSVLSAIRQQKSFPDNATAEDVHNGVSKWLSQTVKRTFNSLMGSDVVAYDLRGCWCAIQDFLVRDSLNMTTTTFYQRMLGHSEESKGGAERPYMKFEVV